MKRDSFEIGSVACNARCREQLDACDTLDFGRDLAKQAAPSMD